MKRKSNGDVKDVGVQVQDEDLPPKTAREQAS